MPPATRHPKTTLMVVVALLLVALWGATIASATRLGTFDDVVLDAIATPVEPCTASDVVLMDGGIDLLTTTLGAASEIDAVRLGGLTGNCADSKPIVVVTGDDLSDLTVGRDVLYLIEGLAPAPGITQTLSEPLSLSGLLYTLHGADVAFCPMGATCT